MTARGAARTNLMAATGADERPNQNNLMAKDKDKFVSGSRTTLLGPLIICEAPCDKDKLHSMYEPRGLEYIVSALLRFKVLLH